MKYIKAKVLLLLLTLGFLFPTAAYAVVDGEKYVLTTNNDVNKQSLHTDISYNKDGTPNFNSMSMTTESTGDHKWTHGAMMHSNSFTNTHGQARGID